MLKEYKRDTNIGVGFGWIVIDRDRRLPEL